MMKNHTVWMWKDRWNEQAVRFVGYGRFEDKHPALDMFDDQRGADSELGRWLACHEVEPLRETYGPKIVSFEVAIAAVLGLRARFRVTLLKTRGPSSFHGGHPARGVFYFCAENIENSLTFESVRAAAKTFGCNPATITRRCQDEKNVTWGYIDNDDGAS